MTSEKTIQTDKQIDENGNEDLKTTQELEVLLLNSTEKKKTIQIINSYSTSQVNNHSYHKGDYLFIHLTPSKKGLSGDIIELKRDHLLVILTSILVALLIIVSGKFGILTFLSFIVNTLVMVGLLSWYRVINSNFLLLLFALALPLMVVIALSSVNGWSLKVKIASVATILGSVLTFLIGFIVISLLHNKGLHYEEMELVTRPPHVLFLSSLLVGSVGAVMDVAMTITSSLMELMDTNPTTTTEDIERVGQKIGGDIMGPMTNIMFFSYLSGAIPLVLIFLRNGMSFGYTFSIVLSLEIARALVGSIGIILAVPLSVKTTQFFLKRGTAK